MINALLLLVWAAGVHFFVIIQRIRQSIMCLLRQGRRIKKHSHPKVLTDNFHPIPP